MIEATNAEQWAEYNYKRGYRAYVQFGTRLFCQGNWSKTLTESLLHERFWHALRAYQDEERKKGVPITAEEAKDFRNYVLIDKKDTVNTWGIGRVDEEVFLTQTYDNRWVARFTNFRWREGYPKPAKSDHCGGTSCPFEYSCVDGCMYPKGGQNG